MKDIFISFLMMILFILTIAGFVWLCVATNGIPIVILSVLGLWCLFYNLLKEIKD